MGRKPFVRLAAPRAVNRPELPPDLAEFYARHEGIGLESSCDHAVRICTLSEVARVGWSDVTVADVVEGWEHFAAFQIGLGTCGEQIVYVLDAPSCPPGSILAIGTILVGSEGGEGPFKLEGSLVLARAFPAWLDHLKRWKWEEPVIAGMGDLPKRDWEECFRYYVGLNPETWLGGSYDDTGAGPT